MKQTWSETEIESLLASPADSSGCYESTQGVTEGNTHVVDLLSDDAGPEYLSMQDVRTLLGIPRSDRYSFDGE